MVGDWEHLGLRVKMVLRGHPQRPSADTEGGVLDPLEFEHSRGGRIWVPDGRGICEDGANEGFVGGEEGFSLLAPGGASKSFEYLDPIAGFVGYVCDVGGEGEMGVKNDTQNPWGPVERKRGS